MRPQEPSLIRLVDDLGAAARSGVDAVIDVRSPSEFAEDHAPGAVNLPVLSDAERAQVGTVYVQDDPFRARRMGAGLVARNIAAHLDGAMAGKGGAWRPLVYCWRGGQRSNAMAAVLSQVGWRTSLLRGGYKTYRRGVVAALYEAAPLSNLVLLDGPTGSGKTAVLQHLSQIGLQVIDLEALAAHRGSLLGALPGKAQPSQKLFESRLAASLAQFDPARPIVLEAESSKVGERVLPPVLWASMAKAPRIELHAAAPVRADKLADLYAEAVRADRETFAALLGRLPRHIGRAEIDHWRALLAGDELRALAQELVERHYDPAYARTARACAGAVLGAVSTDDLSPQGLMRIADQVARLIVGRQAVCEAPAPPQLSQRRLQANSPRSGGNDSGGDDQQA